MKKCAITAALFFFFLSFRSSAQVILDCDFSNGIPQDFILIDADGNEPSSSMSNQGFEVGKPWIALIPPQENNMAACSTSWYKPAGTSDDWMIIPGMQIQDSNMVLRWRAKASDSKHPDGYTVYVAEGTATDQTLFGEPVKQIDEENADWTEYELPLAEYAGKTISVAFVNNSTDCNRLFVDDIYVGAPYQVFALPVTGATVPYEGTIKIKALISTRIPNGVSSYSIGIDCEGQTFSKAIEEPLAYGTSYIAELELPVSIEALQSKDYVLWAEADGLRYQSNASVKSYPRKVLCEDITGMWCQWCVRGIVALDDIRENYRQHIIGLATHSGDALMNNDYLNELSYFVDLTGLPAGDINRTTQCDPGNFTSQYGSLLEAEPIYATMSLSATRSEDYTSANVTINLTFAQDYDAHEMAIGFLAFEDRIQQDGFYQKNGYSGGGAGPMGGWEDKPSIVMGDDLYFDDVLMSDFGAFDGFDGSLPEEIQADQTIQYSAMLDMPQWYEGSNGGIIALLIDRTDHRIVNCERIYMRDLSLGAIGKIQANQSSVEVSRHAISGIPVDASYTGIVIIRYSDGTSRKAIQN